MLDISDRWIRLSHFLIRGLKAKIPNLSFNYHGWWLISFTMLGIG